MEEFNKEKLERAKKRVDAIKGFYIHLTVYSVINAFILINIFVRTNFDGEGFWRWEHFITPFFWGIGLTFHAINTFRLNPFFGKEWEERQIKKYMDEDREQLEKFK
ncbi:MAG: 2TM domain-containing protein [Croceitalea sp.]|nr:2TM domain-containing protein [Croceitalea sp.]NNC35313.1 2TM domain-containing protein [Croceitalea sp.]NNL09440.1 2TM domain-containing protein [Croceitalea sp.]NNM18011.1 2TM domain-containing protein [Croceitalea sp.]